MKGRKKEQKKVTLVTARQVATMTRVESSLYTWLDKMYSNELKSTKEWCEIFVQKGILDKVPEMFD